MIGAIWWVVLVGLASLAAMAALLLVPAVLLSRFLRGIPATVPPIPARGGPGEAERGLRSAARAGAHVFLDLNR